MKHKWLARSRFLLAATLPYSEHLYEEKSPCPLPVHPAAIHPPHCVSSPPRCRHHLGGGDRHYKVFLVRGGESERVEDENFFPPRGLDVHLLLISNLTLPSCCPFCTLCLMTWATQCNEAERGGGLLQSGGRWAGGGNIRKNQLPHCHRRATRLPGHEGKVGRTGAGAGLKLNQ